MLKVLEGVVGSTAYNLSGPSSDIDHLGIFIAPSQAFLGFGLPSKDLTVVKNDPDFTWHEISKYLSLALRCNPTILELLFLDDYTIRTDIGEELIAMRGKFLCSKYIISAYGGYSLSQLRKLIDKGKYPDIPQSRRAKHSRHLLRLIIQAEDLLATGSLQIRLSDEVADYVREMGEWSLTHTEEFTERMRKRAEALQEIRSCLPEHNTKVAEIEQWLIDVRLRSLR